MPDAAVNKGYDFAKHSRPGRVFDFVNGQDGIGAFALRRGVHGLPQISHKSGRVFEIVVAQAFGDDKRVLRQLQQQLRLALQILLHAFFSQPAILTLNSHTRRTSMPSCASRRRASSVTNAPTGNPVIWLTSHLGATRRPLMGTYHVW